MIAIPMKIAVTDAAIPMNVTADEVNLPVSIGASYSAISGTPYEGEYEFTPSEEEQIIPVEGFVMVRDVTIAPIPSNYGKITYNGSVLTVS